MFLKAIIFLTIATLSPLVSGQTTADGDLKEKATKKVKKKRLGIVESSTMLAYRGHWTLVPISSVIHTPSTHKDKIVTKPKGDLLTWESFLTKNSGWIHTHEVTIDQARGEKAINQKVIDAYKSMGKLIVATYKKGPISVEKSALSPPPLEK